jgi:YD repeat-containing protein
MGYAKRTTKVIDPSGHDVEYSYDANGQLKQLKDTKNNATTYDYDANGQVTKKTYADGSYQTMTYNSVGQLIGARDAKNNVAAYEYDAAGRMTKIDYPHDTDVTMSYDALGRLSTKTDGLGTTEYSYDNLNCLISEDGAAFVSSKVRLLLGADAAIHSSPLSMELLYPSAHDEA